MTYEVRSLGATAGGQPPAVADHETELLDRPSHRDVLVNLMRERPQQQSTRALETERLVLTRQLQEVWGVVEWLLGYPFGPAVASSEATAQLSSSESLGALRNRCHQLAYPEGHPDAAQLIRLSERALQTCRALRRELSGAATTRTSQPTRAAPGPRSLRSLTAREHQVLGLLVAQRSNRAIAAALGISERTAEVHVANVFKKLGCSTRQQAVAVAGQLAPGAPTSPGR